jgi:hypothetical protein
MAALLGRKRDGSFIRQHLCSGTNDIVTANFTLNNAAPSLLVLENLGTKDRQ